MEHKVVKRLMSDGGYHGSQDSVATTVGHREIGGKYSNGGQASPGVGRSKAFGMMEISATNGLHPGAF